MSKSRSLSAALHLDDRSCAARTVFIFHCQTPFIKDATCYVVTSARSSRKLWESLDGRRLEEQWDRQGNGRCGRAAARPAVDNPCRRLGDARALLGRWRAACASTACNGCRGRRRRPCAAAHEAARQSGSHSAQFGQGARQSFPGRPRRRCARSAFAVRPARDRRACERLRQNVSSAVSRQAWQCSSSFARRRCRN